MSRPEKLEKVIGYTFTDEDLMTQALGGENPNPGDPVFSVYGANKLKFRVRSHPDVAAIHYPDLV